eukprot:TRINITY_DN11108_c0_g1_i26.p1 TRINITY_DN11108_c0_g1~~TRINITY_DN11108_c0_g1_i26.p1  ORF type:complete len:188 (+),score=45.32 TRINITY_DN11108_c0_g1_i26:144-707(+)
MDNSSIIEYLNAEQTPSVVIFENILSSGESQEVIQDPPLVWVIVSTGKKGSKISDVSWCKTQLKELLQRYVKTTLQLASAKLIWKFTKNPEHEKTRALWYVLYKLHTRIVQYDLRGCRSDTVNLVEKIGEDDAGANEEAGGLHGGEREECGEGEVARKEEAVGDEGKLREREAKKAVDHKGVRLGRA